MIYIDILCVWVKVRSFPSLEKLRFFWKCKNKSVTLHLSIGNGHRFTSDKPYWLRARMLSTLSFDGSNDRAPAFFEADTHYHLLERCKARCHSLLHAFNLIVINDKISHSTIALWFYYAKLTRTFHFSKCFSYNLPVFRIYCYLCTFLSSRHTKWLM